MFDFRWPGSSPELFLPGADVNAVLGHELTPLDISGSEKFAVNGHPNLFVRRDTRRPSGEIREADRGYMNLRLIGVDVLPYAVTEHDDNLYVITYRVDGQPLEEMLHPGQEVDVVNEVDTLYSKLGKYLLDAWHDGIPTAVDVFGPQQFMYGIARRGGPGIKFVDLEMRSGFIHDWPGELSHEAIYIANDIVTTESKFGQPGALAYARETVRNLLAVDREKHESDPYTVAMGHLGSIVLERGEPTDDHINDTQEDIIEKYGSV